MTRYLTLLYSKSDNGSVPERPKGPDCKSGVIDFVGSNPTRPILTYNIIIYNIVNTGIVFTSYFHNTNILLIIVYKVIQIMKINKTKKIRNFFILNKDLNGVSITKTNPVTLLIKNRG